MTGKFITVAVTLGAASLIHLTAFATIYRPAGHEQGNTYEECAVECDNFADAMGCRQFRQANLICTEKKKSTWPIFTTQVQQEIEE